MAIKLFEDLAAECNKRGWFVLNCFQLGPQEWRVNIQRREHAGTTGKTVTEFSDAKTPSEALRCAMLRIPAQDGVKTPLKPATGPRRIGTLSDRQRARLVESFDCLILALDARLNGGTRSGGRENSL